MGQTTKGEAPQVVRRTPGLFARAFSEPLGANDQRRSSPSGSENALAKSPETRSLPMTRMRDLPRLLLAQRRKKKRRRKRTKKRKRKRKRRSKYFSTDFNIYDQQQQQQNNFVRHGCGATAPEWTRQQLLPTAEISHGKKPKLVQSQLLNVLSNEKKLNCLWKCVQFSIASNEFLNFKFRVIGTSSP